MPAVGRPANSIVKCLGWVGTQPSRQANSALWRIVMVRIAHDPETQLYFERRVKEGKTTHEVIRILKRYVAREVYRYLPRA